MQYSYCLSSKALLALLAVWSWALFDPIHMPSLHLTDSLAVEPAGVPFGPLGATPLHGHGLCGKQPELGLGKAHAGALRLFCSANEGNGSCDLFVG